jgi:type IV secretory pathway TrbD component
MARSTPTFRSLTAPQLTGGGERTPMVLAVGMGAFLLVAAWFTWSPVALGLGMAVLVICPPLIRRMANRDPMAVAVGTRFISYKKYYPARTPVSPWKG